MRERRTTRALVAGAAVAAAAALGGCTDGGPLGAPTTTIVVTPPPGQPASSAASSPATATTGGTVTPAATPTSAAEPGAGPGAAGPGAAGRGAGSSSGGADTGGDPQVRALQKALADRGYDVPVTGVFGPLTRAAVERVQREHGLEVDGVAGPRFWQALTGAAAPTSGATPVGPSAPGEPAPTETTSAPAPSAPATTSAPEPTAAPAPVSCGALHDEWVAAVRANSRSRSVSAHDRAEAAGCRPNTWLAPGTTSRQVAGTHQRGDACTMAQVGERTDAGLVCTQDVEGSPHWN